MNRWILRGLTVAGFTAGAWLLGGATAYADDTSIDTTATLTVDVRLGTSAPTAVVNLSSTTHVQSTPTVSTTPATVTAHTTVVQAEAAPAGVVPTSAPVPTDVGLDACVDVALGGAVTGCGDAAGTAGESAALSGAAWAALGTSAEPDGSGVVTGMATADGSGSGADPAVVPGAGTADGSGASVAGSDGVPAGTSAGSAGSVAGAAGPVVLLAYAGRVDSAGTSRAEAHGPLPTTGVDVWWLLGAGVMLLLLGAALRWRTR